MTEERAEEEEECKTASPKILRLNSDEIINQAQRLVKSVRGTTAQVSVATDFRIELIWVKRSLLDYSVLRERLVSQMKHFVSQISELPVRSLRILVTSKTASSPFYGVTAMSPQC